MNYLSIFQGQSYAADIVLDCTGLTPETTLTRQTFGNLNCYSALSKKYNNIFLVLIYAFYSPYTILFQTQVDSITKIA